MSHCLILQLDPVFGPGRLPATFRDYGVPTRLCRLDRGQSVPTDWDEVRCLVILGGVGRLTGVEDEYAVTPDWLAAVPEQIAAYVADDRPTLGFGLGSQVLARALGATVSPIEPADATAAKGQVGWGTIRLPFPGGTDPILFGLGDGAPMFFWQKDTFELPELPPPPGYDPDKPGPPPPTGNTLLASTAWDRNAAFRFRNRIYGFEFHPELTRTDLTAIRNAHGGNIGAMHGSRASEGFGDTTEKNYPRYERLGTRLLENFVQFTKLAEPEAMVG